MIPSIFTSQIIRGGQPVTVRRKSAGKYGEDGFYVPGEACEFTAIMSAQPMVGKEVLQLDEGDRVREHLKVYTTTDVRVDDRFTIDCKQYEIRKVDTWPNHRKAIAVLIDVKGPNVV